MSNRNHPKTCYVYIGIWKSETDSRIYAKAGIAKNPKKRAMQYGTHIPGGLSIMKAMPVNSETMALIFEDELLRRLMAIDGAESCGGEWVCMPADRSEEAFLAHAGLHATPIVDIPVAKPKLKPPRPVYRDKSWISEEQREQERREQVLIEHKKRPGVAGTYKGTPRG